MYRGIISRPKQNGSGSCLERCTDCDLCANSCPGSALTLAGRGYTLREVLDMCREDQVL
ncbi:MAG: 4Fe-4S binding protein [Treponema sp.]|nr:4Fe-4S binding protein [Treponema sp.]